MSVIRTNGTCASAAIADAAFCLHVRHKSCREAAPSLERSFENGVPCSKDKSSTVSSVLCRKLPDEANSCCTTKSRQSRQATPADTICTERNEIPDCCQGFARRWNYVFTTYSQQIVISIIDQKSIVQVYYGVNGRGTEACLRARRPYVDRRNHDTPGAKQMKQKRIAIIGCGLIGQAWATVFVRSGHHVTLYDKQDGAALQAVVQIRERLVELHEHGLINSSALQRGHDLLTVASTLKSSVSDADYVQENGPENARIKSELTRDIDRWSPPGTPIGSSTSGIPASVYAEQIDGRSRCLVVHPINPPHLIPAVEIVPASWTSKSVVDEVKGLLDSVGQIPIVLKKEIDGFVVNRLQGALLREAFQLLDQGVASREAIDKAICDGLGIRWSLLGPFETIHLNAPGGVADYVHRFGKMYLEMFEHTKEPADWRAVVSAGLEAELIEQQPLAEIGNAQGARDVALMQLLAARLKRTVEDTPKV